MTAWIWVSVLWNYSDDCFDKNVTTRSKVLPPVYYH